MNNLEIIIIHLTNNQTEVALMNIIQWKNPPKIPGYYKIRLLLI